MKILCIGYYDKFSRFFLGIKKELKKEYPNISFKVLSIYPSGFLYAFLRFKSSSLISYKAWYNAIIKRKKYLKILNNNSEYKGIEINTLINYHLKLHKNISKKHLQLQAISYIDILHNKFVKTKPEIILSIGDSRLAFEVIRSLAYKFNIPIYFIEQGPFNSTFFDSKGVNANASIRNLSLKSEKQLSNQETAAISSFIKSPPHKPYKRSPLYRGIDYITSKLFRNSFFMPPDIKFIDALSLLKNKKNKTSLVSYDSQKNTFLLLLQVPSDVNMVYHSPYFNNHYDLVKSIHKNLPENSQLVIREHPVHFSKYEKEMYDYIQKNNILIDNYSPLYVSLKKSDVIIVNNSTVGIEAIALKKTIVVLGNAYYDLPEICLKYKNNDLNKLLNKALHFKPNEESINIFLFKFISNYLINGFITDSNLKATKTIAKRILNH